MLLFVDPYGINFYKSTLQRFIDKKYIYFDMFLNLQNYLAARTIKESKNALTLLYGDERWKDCINAPSVPQCLLERYINLLNEFPDDKIKIVKDITIDSGMGYRYSLIFTTRKENSEWLRGIDKIKKTIENLNGKIIEKSSQPSIYSFEEKLKGR